jgi:hypothetical protein
MAEFKINGTLNTTKGVKTKGTNYILVSAAGTDVQNAAELQAAYTAAAAMTPSSTNIITIVASPGYYNFDAEDFEMTDEYINLVSLDGNRSIIFNSGTGYTIYVKANNVYVNGVDTLGMPFKINNSLNVTIENCKGGDYSFQNGLKNPVISGIFINCVGDANSFGDNGATVSGTFTNCIASSNSFGSAGSIASGTFTNCTAGNNSFGNSGTISGTFTNCIGGEGSFGDNGATVSGTFTNCTAGANSFGHVSTLSGTCTNCTAGANSFGSSGTLSGKLYYCRLTAGTFQTVTFPGITRLCLDGNNDENNQTSFPPE